MSMMKKALHMGTSETERAARIFLDDSRRPKSRTARKARSMLTGKLRGPRAMRDARTTKESKRDQLLRRKARAPLAERLTRISTAKMAVKMVLRVSRVCLVGVGAPLASRRLSVGSCASATEVQKFCERGGG